METFLYKNISDIKRLSQSDRDGLSKLGLFTINDLLRYIPIRYINYSDHVSIGNVQAGDLVNLTGTLVKVEIRKSWKSKIPLTEAEFSDGLNKIKLFWFNQAYIGKLYPEGSLVSISGRCEIKNDKLYIANPVINKIDKITEPIDSIFSDTNAKQKSNPLIPIYGETKNITSNYIHELIKKTLNTHSIDEVEETLSPGILKDLSLPTLRDAILYLHFPKDLKLSESAKKRFLFEEMFMIQIKIKYERNMLSEVQNYIINDSAKHYKDFLVKHNFNPTNAQDRVIKDIVSDLANKKTLQRLIEGDVGSGKTMVAAIIIYIMINSKRDAKTSGTPLQAVYLAPTEILAMQQFETLIQLLAHTGIEIGYLSGSTAYKFPSKLDNESYVKVSKTQMRKWISEGKISLLIGTHAVAKKLVTFKDLALIVIDEQHRFGVQVRSELAHKKGDKRQEVPHLISMTATPIPRTLALSIFGDLDLSIIDELPSGRKPITTKLIGNDKREALYKEMGDKIAAGEQAFVICTKISDGEDDSRRSVESEVINMTKVFIKTNPNIVIKGLHSKMKNEEKELIMQDFKNNKINILVATSLVEVGVNIPNASIMLIENADRFGLAQLHQLRGRIGRGSHASTCYVITDSTSDKSFERLSNFVSTSDGFKLAELDMETRGVGSLMSHNQSGMSDIGMEALKNLKLVELAKKYAEQVLRYDPELLKFPSLKAKIDESKDVHME
jgi:ATP-dependent DNA helicase RecG